MKRKRKKPIIEFSGEDWGVEPRMLQDNVCAPAGVTHRDQEWYDAEIA